MPFRDSRLPHGRAPLDHGIGHVYLRISGVYVSLARVFPKSGTHRDWRIHYHDISFFYQEFPSLVAHLANLCFWYRSTLS